jgi:hypothetical protein
MKNTLVQLSSSLQFFLLFFSKAGTDKRTAFDESENYFNDNKVFTVLLGDAIPEALKGTTNDTAFNHYSILATAERNWGLGNLGEGDVGASAFW